MIAAILSFSSSGSGKQIPPEHTVRTHAIVILKKKKSQIGWNFKSKANESCCLYNTGPIVCQCALQQGLLMITVKGVEG